MKNWTIIFAMFFITCLFGAGCEEGVGNEGSDTDVDGDTDTDTDGDSDGDTDADADADADADTDSDTDGDADSETEVDTDNDKLVADCQVLANQLNGMVSDYDGYVIQATLNVEKTISRQSCVITGDFILCELTGTKYPMDALYEQNDQILNAGIAEQNTDGSISMTRFEDNAVRTYRSSK